MTTDPDPTAGERARRLYDHPEYRPPITDPTDARNGAGESTTGREQAGVTRIVDPTDPRSGRLEDLS